MKHQLSELRPGQSAKVTALVQDGPAARRILALGVTPGAVVEIVRVAPMGDPLEVRVRGCRVAFRRADAAGIMVEIV